MSSIQDIISHYSVQVDAQLEAILPPANGPAEPLFAAMRYSVFNGGKRLRPALCFAAAEAVASSDLNTAKVAAALEMIHAYSLIHDDLPAMDDDDLRRGKPTCHIQFDEATAILAGDGLQSLAFQQLCELSKPSEHSKPSELSELSELSPTIVVELVSILSRLGGCSGMVAGQAIDLAATGTVLELDALKIMHAHKTGALIEASVLMGALATGQASKEQLAALKEFAQAIGLAFQIQDDILDVESSTEQLGKQQGSDATNLKSTYTSILGLEQARSEAAKLFDQSMEILEGFGAKADPLRAIDAFIVKRNH
jgi:geranylgeranyl pyrophosphate synthase